MRRVVICLVLVAACKKKSGGGEAEYQRRMYQEMHDALVAPARRGPGFATVPEPLPAQKPEQSGPTHFFVRNVGVVTFNVDGTVTEQKLSLSQGRGLAVGADGTVIVGADHVYKVTQGVAVRVGGEDSPAVDPLSGILEVTPDGMIWVANGSGVFGWDGSAWTKFQTPQTVHDLAFDGKGRVYTASSKQLGVIDKSGWQKMFDLEGTPHEGVVSNPTFGSIGVIGKQLVATHRFGILKLDGTTVEAIDRKAADPQLMGGRMVGDEYISVSDHLGERHIVRTPLSGGPDKLTPIAETIQLSHVEIDARGRVWSTGVGSELYVVDTSGAVTAWPTATLPEITSTIDAIYVVGNGPDKLPGKSAVAKGTIRGRVTNKGAPLAKAYVEICRHPSSRFAKDSTPCGYAPGSTETDDNGAFSIAGLPLQDYSIVIRDGDKWYSLLGTTCGGMKDGDTCDAGELDVANKAFPTAP